MKNKTERKSNQTLSLLQDLSGKYCNTLNRYFFEVAFFLKKNIYICIIIEQF